MERHQQPQRESKSPLLSMNNTMLRSYYVFRLSWVIITAPNPFSRPAVCIKRIFSPLLIKGLAFISSDLQLFIYLQKKVTTFFCWSQIFLLNLWLYSFSPSGEICPFVGSVKGRLVIYWRWLMDSLDSITSLKKSFSWEAPVTLPDQRCSEQKGTKKKRIALCPSQSFKQIPGKEDAL